jgi:hypothetical protein
LRLLEYCGLKLGQFIPCTCCTCSLFSSFIAILVDIFWSAREPCLSAKVSDPLILHYVAVTTLIKTMLVVVNAIDIMSYALLGGICTMLRWLLLRAAIIDCNPRAAVPNEANDLLLNIVETLCMQPGNI